MNSKFSSKTGKEWAGTGFIKILAYMRDPYVAILECVCFQSFNTEHFLSLKIVRVATKPTNDWHFEPVSLNSFCAVLSSFTTVLSITFRISGCMG